MTEVMREPKTERTVYDGDIQRLYEFDNGYGASVIKHPISYGYKSGKWELAVLDKDGDIVYGTPITDKSLGWLTAEDVNKVLADIEALPTRGLFI